MVSFALVQQTEFPGLQNTVFMFGTHSLQTSPNCEVMRGNLINSLGILVRSDSVVVALDICT